MNCGPLLFLGLFFTLASSWYGLVLAPHLQLGRQQPVVLELTGQIYPSGRPGLAQEGADIYRANGCAYCHTQQTQPQGFGSDIERGWGKRRSVAADFLHDYPVMLGSVRVGPDLANIGLRQASEEWHLLHLYNPQILVQGSSMPSYPYLFEKRRGHSAPDALELPGDFAVEPGCQVVPKPKAKALVAYLLSLRADTALFEAPLPAPSTNAPSAGPATNAPAPATTNLPTGPSTPQP